MINFSDYISSIELPKYSTKSRDLRDGVKQFVYDYFSQKPMFNKSDINLYYYDENLLKTNVCANSIMTLYLEINQPNNYKTDCLSKQNKKQDAKIKETYLTLKEIKENLNTIFEESLAPNHYIGQDKYSIIIKIEEPDFNYYLKIIPCFTYKNDNGQEGVIYYDDKLKNIEIEYPKLAIKNFNQKNKDTNGLYKAYTLAFKKLFKEQKQVFSLAFEPFETILYNVPNTLFTNVSKATAFKIINYLRNKNLKDYVTLDEQDSAFTSVYKSLSALYANYAIKIIEKALKHKVM